LKRFINLCLVLFLLLEIIWVYFYFNDYLPNYPIVLVRIFWFATAFGSIFTGIYSVKIKNKVSLSASIVIIGLFMMFLWTLGYLITRM
jgi:hypothetical protein